MNAYRPNETAKVAPHKHQYMDTKNTALALTHYECRVCGQCAPIGLVKGIAPECVVIR